MKIDGRQIADKILLNLKKKVEKLKEKNIIPTLAIILVGNDPASISYVKRKEIKAKEIGIKIIIKRFPSDISQQKLLTTIQQVSKNKNIHGIVIQQPLPKQINTSLITNAVSVNKDVDGFLPNSKFEMPIALAVLKILEEISRRVAATPRTMARQRPRLLRGGLRNWLQSKTIVIIGKGKTGGKPIIHILERMNIPLTIIDSKTKNPENLTRKADIIISAVGKENILKPQMIKRGVALIDIGISRGKNAKLMGDYSQNEIKNIASFYTPTPGGIGPVNVAYLLKNLLLAAEKG